MDNKWSSIFTHLGLLFYENSNFKCQEKGDKSLNILIKICYQFTDLKDNVTFWNSYFLNYKDSYNFMSADGRGLVLTALLMCPSLPNGYSLYSSWLDNLYPNSEYVPSTGIPIPNLQGQAKFIFLLRNINSISSSSTRVLRWSYQGK